MESPKRKTKEHKMNLKGNEGQRQDSEHVFKENDRK